MAEKRFGRDFGTGTLLGDAGIHFFQEPVEKQVYEMGWSHACPVVDRVVQKYEPEWAVRRYAECNFIFGLVVESAKDLNPKLAKLLEKPTKRIKYEEPGEGNYNPDLVPESFHSEMAPLSTPWGYAIPRVLIEQMGRGDNNKDRTQEKMLKALNLIDKSVKTSHTPIELLVKLAESVANLDANPETVLYHTLSVDILREEGCRNLFGEIMRKIDKHAPTLRKTYNSMTPQERDEKEIINF